ncbi:hypothetical protein ACFWPX_30180 [Nocardia sp. NPDC058518]|uniref:hypothetical protein n=1 Tax=Nocardia sp. NPDC058518 TaxID=3346534 RepID=UPI00365A782E
MPDYLCTRTIIINTDTPGEALHHVATITQNPTDILNWTVADEEDTEYPVAYTPAIAIGWRVHLAEPDTRDHNLTEDEARLIAKSWTDDDNYPHLHNWAQQVPTTPADARADAQKLTDDLTTNTPETWPHEGEYHPQTAAAHALRRYLETFEQIANLRHNYGTFR